MNRTIFYIFFFLFTPIIGHCQFLDSTLIKTRPLQDFIGYNPNISLEKPIGPKNSFEVDLMYRNRTWYSNGGEWDFGQFMPSTGYRILGGFRHYISKKKKAPFGFFLGSSVVVKYSMMKDIEMESFEGLYTNTQDVELFQVELIPVFGYQYHISKRISSEFYLGPAFWLFRRESTTVVDSPNPEEIGLTEQMDNGYGLVIAPNFVISFGFLINQKKTKL